MTEDRAPKENDEPKFVQIRPDIQFYRKRLSDIMPSR